MFKKTLTFLAIFVLTLGSYGYNKPSLKKSVSIHFDKIYHHYSKCAKLLPPKLYITFDLSKIQSRNDGMPIVRLSNVFGLGHQSLAYEGLSNEYAYNTEYNNPLPIKLNGIRYWLSNLVLTSKDGNEWKGGIILLNNSSTRKPCIILTGHGIAN